MKSRRVIGWLLVATAFYWAIRLATRKRNYVALEDAFASGQEHNVTGCGKASGGGSSDTPWKASAIGNFSNGPWPQWVHQLLVAKAHADEAAAQAAEAEEVADEVDAEVAGTLQTNAKRSAAQRWGRVRLGGPRQIQREQGSDRSNSSSSSRSGSGSSGSYGSTSSHNRRFKGLSGSDDSSDSIERHQYIQNKLQIDEASLRTATPPSTLGLFAGVKVAFLFIIMDKLEFEAVWDRFFENAPASQYSLYFHIAVPEADRNSTRGTVPLSRWGSVQVPWVPNSWCALMGVEVTLLVAALRDPYNQQFIFLSHNSVPLKGFGYVYRQLGLASPGTSKICFASPAQHRTATAETVAQELKRQCVYRDFYRTFNPRTLKHHQWVVLSRDHAAAVVRHGHSGLRIWIESWKLAAPDIANMGEGCSDEAVPITALLHYIQSEGRSTGNSWADMTRLGVEQQCLTFVHWRHCFGNTDFALPEPVARELMTVLETWDMRILTDKDFNFVQSALKRELNGYPSIIGNLSSAYLSRLTQHGFMFARKLTPNIMVEASTGRVALEELLPVMWAAVDEELAAQKVWTRLETAGQPTSI